MVEEELKLFRNQNREKYYVVIDKVDENPGYNAIELSLNGVMNTYDIILDQVTYSIQTSLKLFFHYHFHKVKLLPEKPKQQLVEFIDSPAQFEKVIADHPGLKVVVAIHDWRRQSLNIEFLFQYRKLAIEYTQKGSNEFVFVLVDISNRQLFEYIAHKYVIGNFEAPGIFATDGPIFYYRNYERFEGPESFDRIG